MAAEDFPPAPSFAQDLVSIGVTGTNGKTSTVFFLSQILEAHHPPVVRTSTLGTYVGGELQSDLPLTHTGFLRAAKRALDAGGRYAVLEVTSEVLGFGFAQAWPFRAGVFTNLSHDHLDQHKSPEHYFASKAQLFHHLLPGEDSIAVINGCDDVAPLLEQVTAPQARRCYFGLPSRGEAQLPLQLEARAVELSWSGTTATLSWQGEEWPLKLRAIGEIFVENGLAALGCALQLGVPLTVALEALAQAEPPRGRFEVVRAEGPYAVVDYAHTPDALERTLATARSLAEGRVFVVFGAGGNRDHDKRPSMGKAASAADVVVLTSDNPRDESPAQIAADIATGVEGPTLFTKLDRAEAVRFALQQATPTDVVVVAGKGHERTTEASGDFVAGSDHDLVERAAS